MDKIIFKTQSRSTVYIIINNEIDSTYMTEITSYTNADNSCNYCLDIVEYGVWIDAKST